MRAGLDRPGDLVVVGDRDRPQAAVAGRLEQHLDRRRAVGRVVGVHVEVDLDQRPPGDPPPRLGVTGAVVAAAGQAAVDRLQLGRDLGPVPSVAARLDHLVGAGEVALEQPRGRRRRDRAGVEATEEDLDQGACHLGRENPLLRGVEGGDVERVGVAQRGRGDARRERLVDVDDVEGVRGDGPLDRVAGAEDRDLVAAPPELLGDPRDVLVDLVLGAPPVGGDLGYREALGRHRTAA